MKVGGSVSVPGDKSITHRVLLLAALAQGSSSISNALTSLDARSSARVLRQLGAEVSALRPGAVTRVRGRGKLQSPRGRLNCGNSGTTTRLLLGVLAAHPFRAILTGDSSLRRRPMRRVTLPLSQMGAQFVEQNGDGLPLTIQGGRLRSIEYQMPVSSAQIKSALLLAGLVGEVEVGLREPHGRSRDHTERLLRAFGYEVVEQDGWIQFRPTGQLHPFEIRVPGDPSSAAFLIGAAALAKGGELQVRDVGLNPTRTGFLEVLRRMGADVTVQGESSSFGEPTGHLVVRPRPLRATEVQAAEVPGLIDEIPLLAIVGSQAEGATIFRGVAELKVKESNRLELIAENLRAVGGQAEIDGDNLIVSGKEFTPRGIVRTAGDHRLAMAFAILQTLPGAQIRIDDMECAAVSFPGFSDTLKSIGRA